MSIINTKIYKNNIEDIIEIINDSYNNIYLKAIDDFLLKNPLYGKKVLIINIEKKNAGILIYSIKKYDNFYILAIEKLCIINKYKSKGYSKILIKELLKYIKDKKYNNCYLSSVIVDLRSVSSIFNDYELISPKKNNSEEEIQIIKESNKILKKWYMIDIEKNVVYIPFFNNIETYNFFNNNEYELNNNQKRIKKELIKRKYCLGYGIGIFNIIKLT